MRKGVNKVSVIIPPEMFNGTGPSLPNECDPDLKVGVVVLTRCHQCEDKGHDEVQEGDGQRRHELHQQLHQLVVVRVVGPLLKLEGGGGREMLLTNIDTKKEKKEKRLDLGQRFAHDSCM